MLPNRLSVHWPPDHLAIPKVARRHLPAHAAGCSRRINNLDIQDLHRLGQMR